MTERKHEKAQGQGMQSVRPTGMKPEGTVVGSIAQNFGKGFQIFWYKCALAYGCGPLVLPHGLLFAACARYRLG